MIKLKNLQKYYGQHLAVEDVSFEVNQGEVVGFLGPNGAGKSTTMKMLTSFILPTSGEAWIYDFSVIKDSLKTRQMIGYLPESSPSYREMKVKEFLDFIADIRGLSGKAKTDAIDAVVSKTFLTDVYHQTIETLSKGYRQRVGLAQAILHDPPVLILDEPTDGLDPNQKIIVRQLIRNLSADKTIILSTHILEEMEAVCSRAIIIDKGKIITDGATDDLLKMADNYNSVKVQFDSKIEQEVLSLLSKNALIDRLSTTPDDKSVLIYPKAKKYILSETVALLEPFKSHILNLEVEKPQIDKVFRDLTEKNQLAV